MRSKKKTKFRFFFLVIFTTDLPFKKYKWIVGGQTHIRATHSLISGFFECNLILFCIFFSYSLENG